MLAAPLGASAVTQGSEEIRHVTLLVGYAPGGLSDRLTRIAAKYLQRALRQPVVVQNVPGAGGIRAAKWLAAAKAQTPTLMFADTSLLVSQLMATDKGLPDVTTFAPVGTMGYTAFVVAVSADAPWQTLTQLIQALRWQPGNHNFGSPGMNSLHQLTVEVLMRHLDATVQHIPYSGGTQMLPDLMAQRIAFGALSTSLALEQSKAHRLRLLAVTSQLRLPQLPEVPALAELYPGMHSVSTAYLLASPSMPPATLQGLRAAWRQALADPALTQELITLQMIPDALDASQAEVLLKQEMRQWSRVLTETANAPPR